MVHDQVKRSLLRHLLVRVRIVHRAGGSSGGQTGDRRGLVVQVVRVRRIDLFARDGVEREEVRMPLEVRPGNADLRGEARIDRRLPVVDRNGTEPRRLARDRIVAPRIRGMEVWCYTDRPISRPRGSQDSRDVFLSAMADTQRSSGRSKSAL